MTKPAPVTPRAKRPSAICSKFWARATQKHRTDETSKQQRIYGPGTPAIYQHADQNPCGNRKNHIQGENRHHLLVCEPQRLFDVDHQRCMAEPDQEGDEARHPREVEGSYSRILEVCQTHTEERHCSGFSPVRDLWSAGGFDANSAVFVIWLAGIGVDVLMKELIGQCRVHRDKDLSCLHGGGDYGSNLGRPLLGDDANRIPGHDSQALGIIWMDLNNGILAVEPAKHGRLVGPSLGMPLA